MHSIKHKTSNDVLAAPAGWDHEALPCDALSITRVEWAGMPAVVSYWRPSQVEVQMLAAGGYLALSVLGSTMPPVSLDVEVDIVDAVEGVQILDDLIANIDKDGNYSKDATLTFLRQIRQCFT